MSTKLEYALPTEEQSWSVGPSPTVFDWNYDSGRDHLLKLYNKGKKQQWDAAERIDWSQDLDPENPTETPDEGIPIYGSDVWNRLTDREKAHLRRHLQAWQISQFLHGEQGALVCAAKVVQQVPDLDAKYYAATQVVDEARHVEVYSRLLQDKVGLAYPITPPLKALLDNIVSDSRWDFTYLGMQVLIEGLALASFHRFRDTTKNPLIKSVNAYVMKDEARHVAFGRLALRDYYPQLTDAERAEREEFVVEACYHMRDRFLGEEVWEAAGLPRKECVEFVDRSASVQFFRSRLFSRIVPTIRDIGLWSKKVQMIFAKFGCLDFAAMDAEALLAADIDVADALEALGGGAPRAE
jgi:hypothetical protein